MLAVALATGARAQELLNITAADLLDADQAVHINGLKCGHSRTIPLKPELFMKLKGLTASGKKPFPISYSRLFAIWQLYRPAKKKFHSLRHTFAIELYKKCRDIRLVQTALGHKSINNTMIYMQLVYTTDEMRKAML